MDSAYDWRHCHAERAFHKDDVAMNERPDDHSGNFICCGTLATEQDRRQIAPQLAHHRADSENQIGGTADFCQQIKMQAFGPLAKLQHVTQNSYSAACRLGLIIDSTSSAAFTEAGLAL